MRRPRGDCALHAPMPLSPRAPPGVNDQLYVSRRLSFRDTARHNKTRRRSHSAGIRIVVEVSAAESRQPISDVHAGDIGRANRLFAEPQPSDRRSISLGILLVHVGEQPAALADHLQQPAAAVMIVLIAAQVIGQLVDPLGQNRNLDLGRAGVPVVNPVMPLIISVFCSLTNAIPALLPCRQGTRESAARSNCHSEPVYHHARNLDSEGNL